MVRRQVSVWVDEEILRLFDEWAWGLRLSRTTAVEQVMGAAVRGTFQLEMPAEGTMREVTLEPRDDSVVAEAASKQEEKKPKVIAELRERMEEVRAACTHPKTKVEKFSWGKRCGECGTVLK